MTTDPTQLSPGELPDIPSGSFTDELDSWLRQALRWSVREDAQGLPDWKQPEDETPAERRARYLPWFYTISSFLWHASTAGLLIRVAQLAPEHADAIATELRDWLDSGDFYPEWVWEWAEKRGLDPKAITDEQREKLHAEAAEASPLSTVWSEVLTARSNAHEKHGVNSIEALAGGDARWLSVLVEEVGEVSHELTYDASGSLRAELIDVLAVASAWVDAIDRGSRTV